MIQMTVERFQTICPMSNFWVVTSAAYVDIVRSKLPDIPRGNILAEPCARNTAPCIAYAAYSLLKIDPEAEMVVTPSDHLILNEEEFRAIIDEGLTFAAEKDALVTIGIRPTRPDTGYGYIQVSDNQPLSKVKCFTEKPDLELAQTFLQCGEFVWNSGIFIWRVKSIVKAFEQYLPEHHTLFNDLMPALGTPEEEQAVERVFAECRAISIDYGVMEKADNVYVRCGDFGWSDVGTWGSVYQHSRKDRYANAAPSDNCFFYDTRSSIVSLPNEKIAVISGLKEYIVVDTEDVLMICPRSEEQRIKKFIDEVKFQKGEKHI